MIGENPAVSYRWTGWVWDITGWSSRLQEITDHFRGIYRIYPILIKENRSMPTCNRLDLQTLGSQPIMPSNLPDHWCIYLTLIFASFCAQEPDWVAFTFKYTKLWNVITPTDFMRIVETSLTSTSVDGLPISNGWVLLNVSGVNHMSNH